MHCKYCQLQIPSDDVLPGQQVVKCQGCQQVFAIDFPSDQLAIAAPQPEQLIIVDDQGQGYLQWRWYHPVAFVILAVAVLWDSYIIQLLCNMNFAAPANIVQQGPFQWLSLAFPLIHLAVAFGLTYFALCLFLNTTQVIFDGTFLTVRSGPLPWRPMRRYSRNEIKGLESEARLGRGYQPRGYQLFVVGGYRSRKDLIGLQPDPVLVRYVQRQLECWLGLPAGNSVA